MAHAGAPGPALGAEGPVPEPDVRLEHGGRVRRKSKYPTNTTTIPVRMDVLKSMVPAKLQCIDQC